MTLGLQFKLMMKYMLYGQVSIKCKLRGHTFFFATGYKGDNKS